MLILRLLFEKTSAIVDSRGKKQPNKLNYSESFAFLLDKTVDKRLEHLPFTSPYSIFTLVALYLVFVLKWGPKFMEHRKPFNIERILIIYNLLQVVLNFTLVAFVSVCVADAVPSNHAGRFQAVHLLGVYRNEFNIYCQPLDFTNSAIGIHSAVLSYAYLLLKILDLFDTVFFVLRKRTRQISFLHVYHHVVILMGSWVAISWAPGKGIARFPPSCEGK